MLSSFCEFGVPNIQLTADVVTSLVFEIHHQPHNVTWYVYIWQLLLRGRLTYRLFKRIKFGASTATKTVPNRLNI